MLVARYGWRVPALGDAERAAYDLRTTAFAPQAAQDPRIIMVVYNDQTLIATRKRSPLDRGLLARALRAIDALGPRRIGIDILFDQPQDEDATLIAALRAMKTPTYVAYAELSSNRNNLIEEQEAYLRSVIQQLAGSNAHPASIRVEVDADNVARQWPYQPSGLPPRLTNAMEPGAVGFADYHGAIRYRLPKDADRPVFATLPIDLFADPALAGALADQIRGRDVLIGGDIIDIDRFEVPMTGFSVTSLPGTGRDMPGLEVHATMLAQALDGARLTTVPGWMLWAAAILVVLAAAGTSLAELGLWRMSLVLATQASLFVGIPLLLQSKGVDTLMLPALGWLIGWALAFAAVSAAARAVGTLQRRFAQSALGKYLPRDIARSILDDPSKLALHGERREIFVLFSDLEGFTELSHQLAPEQVASLLNRYLDTLSQVVLDHGGTIDKFVGDAVVAIWGAPIARPEDGANAARAALAMWQAGEDFRKTVPSDLPKVGRTRVGLHFGTAIVGNFGGEGRIQYTALGDTMNTAARLESANKQLGTSVVASREAAERSGLDWWRPLGAVRLRGRPTPVDLFEPAPTIAADERAQLAVLVAAAAVGEPDAVSAITALALSRPDDRALAKLSERLSLCQHGEAYDLL
ncbi:MAG: adenylate/guanylate cyclase domain-containing protein [Sphingomonas sp.]|nr:adenylate/guanylate cyclase domain-containing protein [Sphingomonas sp.]